MDTLDPRLTLTRTVQSTGSIRYLTTAQDFNLQEEGFKSPCGVGVISSRASFDAPWYAGLFGDDNRLNTLTADCTLPYFVTQSEVGAYNTVRAGEQRSGELHPGLRGRWRRRAPDHRHRGPGESHADRQPGRDHVGPRHRPGPLPAGDGARYRRPGRGGSVQANRRLRLQRPARAATDRHDSDAGQRPRYRRQAAARPGSSPAS